MSTYQYGSPWDFSEHQRALRAVASITVRRQPWLRAFRIAFPLLLISLAVAPLAIRGRLGFDSRLFTALLPWFLILGLWVFLIDWGQFYLAARRTRRLDPSARGMLTRTFSDHGFRIDGTGQAVELSWDGVHSALETPEFFLIFFNKLCAYYVPKRLIPPEEQEPLRALLRAKVKHLGQTGFHGKSRAA